MRARLLLFVSVLLVGAGCGGDEKKSEEGKEGVQAACKGSPLGAPILPAGFPKLDSVTYTRQSMQGPTQVVEGYYRGDVKSAHDDFKGAFQSAGFTVLFDEVEEHDSEVSWKGKGRTGQVALRDECGEADRTYVHITNRPA